MPTQCTMYGQKFSQETIYHQHNVILDRGI